MKVKLGQGVVKERPTPIQRARMRAAAEALATGKHTIPFACHRCRSTSVFEEQEGVLTCVACGKETSLETAHRLRKQEIAAFIEKGIDIPLQRDIRQRAKRD